MNQRKILIILFLLAFFPLFLYAQDIKPRQLKQEHIEKGLDTISTVVDNNVLSIEIDSLSRDSLLPWPLYMTARLDTAMRTSPYMKGVTAGVMVYDFTADSVLYRFNEKKLLKPASTEKLLTGITALRELGEDYPFHSRLYYTGEVKVDTIYFVPDSIRVDIPFEELVDTLGNPLYKFMKVFHGDIYGIGSYDPVFSGTDLNAFADSIVALGMDSIAGNIYEDVSNRYSITISPFFINKNDSFTSRLKDALKKRNILFSGFTGTSVCPEDTVLLAEQVHTLKQIMNRMMKQSDNQYAEAVYHKVGSLRNYPIHGIKNLINELGFNPDSYIIADGSGLSHDNKVSPELEIAFLKYARENDSIYNTLYSSLPIAGVDGTLSERMKELPAYRNVRAKTGTLNGVITLSGYCTSANNHELIFAIMLNDIKSSVTAKALEDELCTIMTHDETFIPKKKIIVVKHRPVRRRTAARKRRRR
ncbi:MAG: D-alanyl-D-alanine carboxypeptidase/D-alanyl-D-alanine-endopeptidase [Bacteroidaceae bacterium]|nr:D-alanyl-D-alanine carboxypeptidase/D-alanyl-D-alanine-endopeptidase [Bacteroidaceae bacterium]